MLEVRDIRAGYGPLEVLHGISLSVAAGEMVCIIGANGAGKSSLLRCISGLLRPGSGSIVFDGQPIDHLEAHAVVARGLTHVPEGRHIFPRLSVLENLEMGAFLLSKDRFPERLGYCYSLFPVLKERASQAGGTLSGGEQQMLAIGRALMSAPRMLLLDEPSMGVAPILCERIFGAISEMNSAGLSVLIVEQNAHAALRLSSRAYVLETGTIGMEGRSRDLIASPRVRELYLGGG